MNLKSILILFLLGIFIIVCIQNVEDVPLHLLFWKFEISKLLMLLLTLIIGIVTGVVISGLLKKTKEDQSIEKK